jgi:L-seryl-tRNA(Ser) seleniumtransferase
MLMDGQGGSKSRTDKLRTLPQMARLLEAPEALGLASRFSRAGLVAALRTVLDDVRDELRAGGGLVASPESLIARAAAALETAHAPRLVRVINATGIILHTNLGRAPLAAEAIAAIAEAAAGYCNLEFDLASGARGSRIANVEQWICQLTGAEAGLAVNNNAAAVLLALSALAGVGSDGQACEVIVSRGELVEIGGGFRIPDIISQGGARLVEVGTTNKTRVADYAGAIAPATRVLLKVHQSNFRITGFTASVELPDLAALAREKGLMLVHDLGSGAMTDLSGDGHDAEPTVQQSIAAGSDIVAFSGDKLFGGPQAGILAGRAAAIDTLRRHPLLRAVRLDKLSLAALEATLCLHVSGANGSIPAVRMLCQRRPELQQRAERLAGLLNSGAEVELSIGYAGGGTMPGSAIPSVAVALPASHLPPETVAARLRAFSPPVVGRIADGRVLLDMLAVQDSEVETVAAAVLACLAS